MDESQDRSESWRGSDTGDRYPNDNTVDIAVLYERMSHIVSKLDEVITSIDTNNVKQVRSSLDLEARLAHLEKQFGALRWFLTGIAAGSGVLGGVVASAVVRLFGGS